MAMPSGWRNSLPSPRPTISGSAPNSAAMVVIMIGRKRITQASKMASRDDSPRWRSASTAKSIIMIAFFFTMPIRRITPIIAMMSNSVCDSIRASTAPTPADGSVERIVSGWT